MKTRILAFSIALMAVASMGASAVAADKIKLRMAHPSFGFHSMPIGVAQDRGFFAREGLEVQHNFMAGGSPAAAALIAGSVDAMTGALAHVAKLRSKNVNVKVLIGVAGLRNWAVVVNAKRHPNVRSLKDMKGLSIATSRRGSDGDQIVRYLLDGVGLSTTRDVKLIQVKGYQNHLLAVERGDIDGSMLLEPFITAGVLKGTLRPVLSLMEGQGPDVLLQRVWTAVIMTEDGIKKNPELAEKLTRAFSNAIKSMYADREATLKVARDRLPSVDPKVIDDLLPRLLSTPRGKSYITTISKAAVDAEMKFLMADGTLDKPIPYEDMVYTRMSKFW